MKTFIFFALIFTLTASFSSADAFKQKKHKFHSSSEENFKPLIQRSPGNQRHVFLQQNHEASPKFRPGFLIPGIPLHPFDLFGFHRPHRPPRPNGPHHPRPPHHPPFPTTAAPEDINTTPLATSAAAAATTAAIPDTTPAAAADTTPAAVDDTTPAAAADTTPAAAADTTPDNLPQKQ